MEHKTVTTKYAQRKKWILRFLKKEIEGCDILNMEFSEKFIKENRVRNSTGYRTLGRTLTRMFKEGLLQRTRITTGVKYGEGFPNTVYVYQISKSGSYELTELETA